MSHAEDAALRRRWAETWARADKAMDQLKLRDLRSLDTRIAMAQLADAFDHAVSQAQPAETSGLVIQQRLFAQLRR